MKNKTKETELQKVLIAYDCPECNSSQLISKPHPNVDKNGGCAVLTSIVTCMNPSGCGCRRKVRRYPNGTYRSFKLNTHSDVNNER